MTAQLVVDSLSLNFRTRHGMVQALDDVSLNLGKGEILGVVGESGSGKSVTAYAVMGLLDDTADITNGRINLGGAELLGATPDALNALRGREMAMIFQSPRTALNPIRKVGLQIEDVLREHANIPARELKREAIAALARVRIPDPERRAEAYPFELSGGMCQRVMIAMALACTPSVLIADEPTTGLDVTTQAVIMDLIRDMSRSGNMSTLLITHDLGLAGEYCDQIAVMHAGHIVEVGPTEAILSHSAHPYTRQLLAATPTPETRMDDLIAIPGSLPDLRSPLPVCRFSARCERRQPICDEPPAAMGAMRAGPRRALQVSAMTETLLEATKLAKFYPVKGGARGALLHAVDEVDLVIGAGESVGLVGESGCGKSTMVRLLARLVDPTSGAIALSGRDITDVSQARFVRSPDRARIQVVFQDPTESLNPSFRVSRAIADPLRRLLGLRDAADIDARVQRAAELVGLPAELLNRYPHQLSGGQRARVGIARAIAVEPSLLILDEPTSALDVSVQAVVLKLLAELRDRLGMSYLFVSHDLNVVRLLCSRVAVMYLGKIVEVGPTEALFTEPRHPYTAALVGSIPDPARRGGPRARLDGSPTSPIDPDPRTCRFYSRCAKSADMCNRVMPLLRVVSRDHSAACHFA